MKKYKKSYKNNKFQISAPTWNDKFELPDRSYSGSDTQCYFQHLKQHGEKTDNLSIRVYVNKEKRITFKIKIGYYLEFLTTETMKLLGNTKIKITRDKIGEHATHLQITEVVLVYYKIYYKVCYNEIK